jgi:Neprosin
MNLNFFSSDSSPQEDSRQNPAEELLSFSHQSAHLTICNQFFRSRVTGSFLSTVAVMASIFTGQARAETATAKFVPFNEFVQSVKSSDSNEFLARPAATARLKVSDSASVEEMRQHILKTYDGLNVSHSYVMDTQTVDCIPVDQQPAVRLRNLKSIASAPPSSAAKAPTSSAAGSTLAQLPIGKTTDDFGNKIGCEANTIPMARITLEQLSRFKNLHEFFQKGPDGAGQVPLTGKVTPPSVAGHKYSHAYQYVNALGDNTRINLWRNFVWTDLGEVFSLAQSWTVGVSSGPVQTAEVGMQTFPDLYGSNNPALFVYYTADGYQNTGCYNLSCGAFVQVNNSVTFGVGFDASAFSTFDGPQGEIQLEYYMWQGNWWLMVNGTWIGYYPGSLYNGGQLAYYANLIDFGSESVGTNVWPGEGSGLFADTSYVHGGYTYAAYQRTLYYLDLSYNAIWDTLTPSAPSPSCYSITQPAFDSNSGVYFYFGGPGGASCE